MCVSNNKLHFLYTILLYPTVVVSNIDESIGIRAATAADIEGTNADKLVLVNRRSTCIANAQTVDGVRLLAGSDQAKQTLILQMQLLLALVGTECFLVAHLQAMSV